MNDGVVEIDAGIETMRMGGPPLVVFGAGAPSGGCPVRRRTLRWRPGLMVRR